MEHIDIGDDPRLNAMVAAAVRGDGLRLSRFGEDVAQLTPLPKAKSSGSLNIAALDRLQRIMAPLRDPNETGVGLVRRLRDESET